MIENISTTHPTARKNYFCDLCNDYILKGTKHECQVNKLDDEEADGNIRELWGKQSQLIELFGYDNLIQERQI